MSGASARSKSFGSPFQWRQRRKGSFVASQLGQRLNIDLALSSAHLRKESDSSFVLNPQTSSFLSYWDRVAATALVFVVIVSPVHVAMFEATGVDTMFVINSLVDFVFFLDMLFQFFIMYPKDKKYGQFLEHRQSKIVKQYLKKWFIVDLVSVVPFDALTLLTDWQRDAASVRALKVVRVLRLVKLARVMRAPRLVQRYQIRMSITYKTLSIVQFFTILLTITHWLATLWAFTLVLVEDGQGAGQPRWIDGFDELDQNVLDKTKDTPWKLYLTCLYFTTYTLTSVGYGDIGPKNVLERIVCIFMIVISGTSWAVLLGQVSGIIANINPAKEEFQCRMDDLQAMLTDQAVPLDMKRKIMAFFKSSKHLQRRLRHDSLMQTMSPGLRGEVMTHVYSEWIEKVSMLRKIWLDAEKNNLLLLRNFVYDLSMSMSVEARAQSELFGSPHVLYILNRGLVGRGSIVKASGSIWGQDFLLTNPALLEPVESFALTYVEVTNISRAAFYQLVEKHRAGNPQLKKHVRYFVSWLATQRAIRYMVKKRLKRSARDRANTHDVGKMEAEPPKSIADAQEMWTSFREDVQEI